MKILSMFTDYRMEQDVLSAKERNQFLIEKESGEVFCANALIVNY
jgi:hypothetical protein